MVAQAMAVYRSSVASSPTVAPEAFASGHPLQDEPAPDLRASEARVDTDELSPNDEVTQSDSKSSADRSEFKASDFS
jgi:hypothetical protein